MWPNLKNLKNKLKSNWRSKKNVKQQRLFLKRLNLKFLQLKVPELPTVSLTDSELKGKEDLDPTSDPDLYQHPEDQPLL